MASSKRDEDPGGAFINTELGRLVGLFTAVEIVSATCVLAVVRAHGSLRPGRSRALEPPLLIGGAVLTKGLSSEKMEVVSAATVFIRRYGVEVALGAGAGACSSDTG